ncbi:MAG: preprotein translocase subunit YajC [Christensenellaceae bacterium]|jgi:preprotein translocase subunit YajC|nr:preprotein translocase subunit YajC [Christensenellaceae bacterium]
MSQSITDGLSSIFNINMLIPLLLIVMIIFMFTSQRKREKKVRDMLSSVKVGDRIRTIGGIYGTVSAIKGDIITIVVGPDKVHLVFIRSAIANIEDNPVEATMDDVKD